MHATDKTRAYSIPLSSCSPVPAHGHLVVLTKAIARLIHASSATYELGSCGFISILEEEAGEVEVEEVEEGDGKEVDSIALWR